MPFTSTVLNPKATVYIAAGLVSLSLIACQGAEHAPDPDQQDAAVLNLSDASVEGGVADGSEINDSNNFDVVSQDSAVGNDAGLQDVSTASDTNSSDDSSAPSCQSDRQCEQGAICVDGDCVSGCRVGEDCPTDTPFCADNESPPGTCVECRVGQDCQAPLNACIDGRCTQACTGSGDCEFPMVCDTQAGNCVRCMGDEQCTLGNICTNNDCVSGCRDDDNCPDGEVCSDNHCSSGCRADSDCTAGLICVDTTCTLGCRPATANSADTCPLEQHCDATTLLCVEGCGSSNDRCPDGETCLANACYAACGNNDSCPDGEHCDSGYCVAGCVGGNCPNNQVCDSSQDALGECVECYSGDSSVCENSPVSKLCDVVNRECTAQCDSQQTTFYCENILGWVCDAGDNDTCVECLDNSNCGQYQRCDPSLRRCVNNSTRPLCAPCESDSDCGGDSDLCVVNDLGRFASEKVCALDCSQGQACPQGTACLPVGDPVRSMQCIPVNSVMDSTSCAARNDLIARETCDNTWQCGFPQISDAICSGYGSSQNLCTVLCDPAVSDDCPQGFFCEDPPAEGDQDPAPRCAASNP